MRSSLMTLTVAALATLFMSACSEKTTGGNDGLADGECAENSDCESGQVCNVDTCESVCGFDTDCESAQICSASVCVVGDRPDPKITALDGDGTVICPDADGTHCMAGGIVLTGENFEGAVVELHQGSATGNILGTLNIRGGATDTSMTVDLIDVAEGVYYLTVTNNAGSADQAIQLLQGPPGPDLTANELVSRINSATSVIDAGVLPVGTAATDVAAGDHAHSQYFENTGGTISGDTTISGALNADSGLAVTGSSTVTGSATVTGPSTVNGVFSVTGSTDLNGPVTINGRLLGYADSPLLLSGMSTDACRGITTVWGGYIEFPTDFPAAPVFVGTIDESLNNSGAGWMRIRRAPSRNRVGLRCGNTSDATPWMAIEPGNHVIDGKSVMAGVQTTVSNGQALFFPAVFPTVPILILMIDESGNDSGATYVRAINAVSTGGFEVYLNNGADAVHWIAMEAGDYQHGRYRIQAGQFNTNNACSGTCTFDFPQAFTNTPNVMLTVLDTNNSGATYARLRNVTETSVSFRTANSAGAATTEFVNFIAIEEIR